MRQSRLVNGGRTWLVGLFGLLIVAAIALDQRPASSASDPVIVDGTAVPDIGPLPTSVPMPPANLSYKAKVDLGKQLYFDGRLSKNGAISCAFCHNPGTGFADPRENVVAKLNKIKGYREQFQAVFGTDVNLQGLAEAIAAYERTVISTDSDFDKYVTGNKRAMTESAIRGMAVFKGKGRCLLCHNGPNFTDNQFHNLGVPQVGPLKDDPGRYNVTRDEHDKGAFKTPTLRSIAETAPYMHDGAFATLEAAVDFLDEGGGANSNLSPLIKKLGLSKGEKTDLVEFLKALSGEPIKFVMPKLP